MLKVYVMHYLIIY